MFVMSNPLAAASKAIPKDSYPLSIMMVEEPQPKEAFATFSTRPSEEQVKRGFTPLDAHNAGVKRKYGMAGAPKYLRNLAGVDFASSILTKTAVARGLVFNDGMKKRSMFIANDGGITLRLRSQIATVIRNRVLSVMPKEEKLARGGLEHLYPPGYGRDPEYGTANKESRFYYNPVYGQSSTYEEMLEATTTGFMAAGGNYHFMGRLVDGMPKDPKRGLVQKGVAVTREEALKAHIHCGFLHAPHTLAMGAKEDFTVWGQLQPAWKDPRDACKPLLLNAEVGSDGMLHADKAIKINLKADLGLPYCAKGTNPEALAAAFAVAKAMDGDYEYRSDAGAYYRRDFNRAPWRVAVLGKTKTDIYKLKKIESAGLRFVNVVPAHLKMLMARTTQKYDEEKTSLIKQSTFWMDHTGNATGPESIDILREGNACMGIARARYHNLLADPAVNRRDLNRFSRHFGDWPGLNAGSQDLERAYLATNGLLRSSQKIGMTQETPGLIINSLDVQIREGRSAWTHCGDDTIVVFRTVGYHTVNTSLPDQPPVLVEKPTFRLYGITTDFKSFDLTQDLTLLAENINVTAEAMSRIDANDAKLWKAIINERKVLLVDGGVVDMKNGGASGINLQSSLNDMHTDVFCQRLDKALLKKCKVGRLGKDPSTGAIIQLPGNIKVPPPIQDNAINIDYNYRGVTIDAFYHPDPLSKEDVERLAQDVARSLGFEVTLGSFACCDNPEITSDTYQPETAKFFDGPYKWNHQVTTWLSLEKLSFPFLGMEVLAARPVSTTRPFAPLLEDLYKTNGFPPAVLDNAGNNISPHLRVIEHARQHYTSIHLDKRAKKTGGVFSMAPQLAYAAKQRGIYRDSYDGGEVLDRTYIDEDGDEIHYLTMIDEDDVREPEDCTIPGMTTVGMNTIGIAQVQLSRAVKNLLYSGKMWIKDKNEHVLHDCIRLLSMVGNWGTLSISDHAAMSQWEKMVSETQSYWPLHSKIPQAKFDNEEESEAALFHPSPNRANSFGVWPVNAFPYEALSYCHISQNVDLEIARFDAVNWLMIKLAQKCTKGKNGMRELAKNSGEMYDFFASDPDSDEKNPLAMAVLAYFQTEEEENMDSLDGVLGTTCTFSEAKEKLPRAVLLALYGTTGLDKGRPQSGARSNWAEMPSYPIMSTSPNGCISWLDVHPAMKVTPPFVKKINEEAIRSSYIAKDAEDILTRIAGKERNETYLHWFNKSSFSRYRRAVFRFYEVVDKVWGHPYEAAISRRMAALAHSKRMNMVKAKWVLERYPNGIPFQNMYPPVARKADEEYCIGGMHGMNSRLTVPARGNLPATKMDGRKVSANAKDGIGRWDALGYYKYLGYYYTHPTVVGFGQHPTVDQDVRDWVHDPETNEITSVYGPFGGENYIDDPSWGVRSVRSMQFRIPLADIRFEDFWSASTLGFGVRGRVKDYIITFAPNQNSITFGHGLTITIADIDLMDEACRISGAMTTAVAYYEQRASPLADSRFADDLQKKVDAMTCVIAVPDDASLDPLGPISWVDEMEDAEDKYSANKVLSAEYLWRMGKTMEEEEKLDPTKVTVFDPQAIPIYEEVVDMETGVSTETLVRYEGAFVNSIGVVQSNVPKLSSLAMSAIAERIFETGLVDGGLPPLYMPDLNTTDPTVELMERMLDYPSFPDISGLDLSPRKRHRGPILIPDASAGAPALSRKVRIDPAAKMNNLRPPTEKNFGRPPPNVEVRDATAVAITEGGAAKTRVTDNGLESTSGMTKTQKRKASRKRSAAAKAGFTEKANYHNQDFSAQDDMEEEKAEAEEGLAASRAAERAYRLEGGN